MKFKGKISISRYQGSGESGVSVEIRDELSGVRFVRAEMSVEAFGFAITGMGCQECEFELTGTDLVGMIYEHKAEVVPCESYSPTDKEKRKAVKPFEVDGWKAHLGDLGNGHMRTRHPKGFEVNFGRYVPNPNKP